MFSLTSLVPLSAVVSLSFFFFSIFKRVLWKKALCFAFNDGCPPLLPPPLPPWQPVTTRCLLPLHVFNNNCVAYFSAMGLALNFKGLVQLYVCVCVCNVRPRQTVYSKSITAKKFCSANCKRLFLLPSNSLSDFAGHFVDFAQAAKNWEWK